MNFHCGDVSRGGSEGTFPSPWASYCHSSDGVRTLQSSPSEEVLQVYKGWLFKEIFKTPVKGKHRQEGIRTT